ncbi:non-ribosomal peptide synthetase [Cellulomonas telluris]|uniref:non-ribosomal peptide synthetase n=1 Tax=Cellulomonas telluris TaxID=2306636 RepID=UPI0010A7C128|nr:non-ribosomal peptide synthetase [Cellulomonas telluris]
MPTTVVDALVRAAAAADDGTRGLYWWEPRADRGTRVGHRELDARCRAAAARLRADLRPGSRVLLAHPASLDYLVAFLGCLYAGMVPVPAYPPAGGRWERVDAIARDCGAAAVVTSAALRDQVRAWRDAEPGAGRPAVVLTGEDLGAADVSAVSAGGDPVAAAPDDVAFLQYTSGSTSAPKGVVVTHGALAANERAIAERFGHDAGTVVVSWLPLFHDMGLVGGALQSLWLGATGVLMAPETFLRRPVEWLRAVDAHRATTSGGPGFAYDLCVARTTPGDRAELDLSSWRVAFHGAEPVRARTLDRFARAFAGSGFREDAVLPCYGLAESTLMVTAARAGAGARTGRFASDALAQEGRAVPDPAGVTLVSCGAPAAGHAVRVRAQDGTTVPDGTVGEICVAGPSLAAGYWRAPEASAATFPVGPDGVRELRTGDLGFVEGGELYVTGRASDRIVVRGRTLAPQDLEATVDELGAGTRRSAALAVTEDDEEHVVLVVEAAGRPGPQEAAALAEHVRAAVTAEHGVPVREVVAVRPGQVETTSSGKVARRRTRSRLLAGELAELGRSAVREAADALLPGPEDVAGDAHAFVRARLSAALRRPLQPSDLDASAPSLGLDSLQVVALVAELEDAGWTGVDAADVLGGATVRALADRLVRADACPRPATGTGDEALTSAPATASQRRQWLLDQLGEGRRAAVVPVVVDVEGHVDEQALRDALAAVARGHAALRVRLRLVDDELRQEVDPRAPVPLVVHDLRALGGDDRERVATELVDAAVDEPFDLTRAPLWRAVLLRLAPDAARLVLVLHHTVADGWSVRVVLDDLAHALDGGTPDASRADAYLRHAAGTATTPVPPEDLEYWRTALTGAPQMLDLPLDHRRPVQRGFRGRTVRRAVGPDRADALVAAARAAGVTPFAVLCGAVATVLARWTGQRDLLVGAPVAQRSDARLARAVGPLLTTVPLRVRTDAQATHGDLARQVADATRGALAHAVPFEALCDAVLDRADPAVPPLCQVFVNHLAFGPPERHAGGLRMRARPVLDVAAKFDVALYLVGADSPGAEAELVVVHDADLVEPARAEELLDQCLLVLDEAVRHPGRPWDGTPLQTDRGRALADVTTALPDVPAPTVADLLTALERHGAERPAAVAVRDAARSLTYAELAADVDGLARALLEAGAGPDDVVLVDGVRDGRLPGALLAVLRAGAAFCVLDAGLPTARRVALATRVGPAVWLTLREGGDGDEDVARALGDGVPRVPVDVRVDGPAPVRATAGAAGSVVLTSGSRGEPRAVLGARDALTAFLAEESGTYGLGVDDRFAMLSALGHDPLQRDVLTAVWNGATVLVPRAEEYADPVVLWRWLRREGPTVAHLTPSTVRFLATGAGDDEAAPTLRLVTVVGEVLDRATARLAARLFPAARVVQLYGATETQRVLTRWEVPHDLDDAPDVLPVGRPPAGAQVVVMTERGLPAGVGELGEVALRSRHLALGYRGDPGATAARFVVNPWRPGDTGDRLHLTGDRGRLDPDGTLRLVGRTDRQLQVRGFRVEPAEIEAAVADHPAVTECVVLGDRPGTAVESTVAYVVGSALERVPDAELRAHVEQRLPSSMVPRRWVRLPALPRGATGKVDTAALRVAGDAAPTGPAAAGPAPVVPGRGGQAPAAAPGGLGHGRTHVTELRLAALWAETLDVEWVDPADSFFALGGDSLRAAALLARVRRDLGVEVTMRELFGAPTLGGLARLVAGRRAAADERADLDVVLEPDPAGRFEPFPLNDIQEAYWVGRLASLDGGGVASHSYTELDGPAPGATALDPQRLRRAFQRLVERHDMLRCVVTPDGRQRVLDPAPRVEVVVHDVRDASADAVERHLRSVRDRLSHLCRDGTSWPLFDVEVSLLPGGRHRVHLSVDFLVADASSWGVLAPELTALYADPDAELPAVGLRFRDYVLAERARVGGPAYRRAEEYWRSRGDLPPGPALPGPAGPGPAQPRAPRFRRRAAEMPAAAWAAVRATAAAEGVTPNALLAAAFAEVLSGWSATSRFTLDVTMSGREPWHPDVPRLVGDFTSLTLVDVDSGAAPDLRTLVRAVHERLWESVEHRAVSGVRVLRTVAAARGGEPLAVPVVFTSKLGLDDGVATSGTLTWLGERAFALTQTPQVTLDHQVSQAPDGRLVYNWDAVDDAYAPGVVDAMFAAYGRLLTALAADPTTLGRRFDDLLTPDERRRRDEANATGTVLPTGALDAPVRRVAAVRPDAPAVLAPAATLTHGQLDALADDVTRRLVAAGCAPGELVAVVMDKGWEQVPAVLGVLRAGAAYLPVDAGAPARRVADVLRLGRVRHVLTQPGVPARHRLAELVGHVLEVATAPVPAAPPSPRRTAAPADLAYVIFTSGSTGTPQGVMMEHGAALNTVLDVNARHGVSEDDRVYGISGLGFDLSVYDVFGLLGAGGAVVLPHAESLRDPAAWHRDLHERRVTVWNSAPALMVMLVEWLERHGERLPDALRLVLLSGDWVPVDLADRVRALGRDVRVVSMGGATEAAVWSIDHLVGARDPSWPSVPYGRPMANQRFHVVDEHLRTRPDWAVGRLLIAGAGLARGYWDNPARTQERFFTLPGGERCYRTGDLGRVRPCGDIEFLGREDFQLKIQGHRVEPGEVEAAVRSHPDVDAVVAVGDGTGAGRRLVAYVVARPGSPASTQTPSRADGDVDASLRAHVAERLPAALVPSVFVLLPALPVSTNGKVDRAALPPVPAASLGAVPRTTGPAPFEDVVAEAFDEVLGCGPVAADQNFFALGGTSLSAIRLQDRLHRATGVELAMPALFRHGTVAELAALLDAAGRADRGASRPTASAARQRGEEMRRARGARRR